MRWMVVALIKPEPSLRGWLRRYLAELPGLVFVGCPNARVRDAILAKIKAGHGKAAVVSPVKNEMGFGVELINHDAFVMRDFDGLRLPTRVGDFLQRKKHL